MKRVLISLLFIAVSPLFIIFHLIGCNKSTVPLPFTDITVTDSLGNVISGDRYDWCGGCGGLIPSCYSFYPAYPNPATDSIILWYGIPQLSLVSLTIRNIYGQKVITLLDYEQQDPDYHFVTWYLQDWMSNKIPSGIYRARLECFSSDKKLIFDCEGDIEVK